MLYTANLDFYLTQKFKIMKKNPLILMALFISLIGYSQTFVDTFVTYAITSTTNNTVQAIDYDTAGGTVVNIPSTVDYNSVSYTVTAIANTAFLGNQLTSINIPNSVTSIGNNAFFSNNLSSVTIPDSAITIGDGAFAQNNNMVSVIIGNSVTSIGAFAFRFNSLTSVTIPDSVITIGTLAFQSNAISSLVIGNGLTSLSEQVFAYNDITSVTIPNSVTNIGANAFIENNLTDIVIPNNVISIGENAFVSNDLSELTIGNSVTSIGTGAFNTNQLTSVTFPESVTSIGDYAFFNNPLLTTIISLATSPPSITTGGTNDTFTNRNGMNLIIPNGATGDYVTNSGALWTGFKMVFEETNTSTNTLKVTNYNAASGSNAVIPSSFNVAPDVYNITAIGNGAFFDKGLTSVTIPNGVTTIGVSAFNTNNLTNVVIPNSVITISSQAFVTNDLTNVTIGNNVTNIEFGAFADNDLTSITFPSSVTTIGSIAFAANPLTDVTSLATTPATITTGTNDTFHISGDRSNIHLHIPSGTLGVYVTNAGDLWTGFNPVSEDASLSNTNFELENGIKIVKTANELKVISSGTAKLKNYSVYSITGAKIEEGIESTININTLSNGIYILELNFDTGKLVKKFAK